MSDGPELALGTVQFGLSYGLAGASAPVAEQDVRTILRHASSVGVTRLDTAAAYGDIEERLARLVGDLPFSVVSKIPPPPPALDPQGLAEFVAHAIAQSHARLGGLLAGLLFHDRSAVVGERGAALWSLAKERCERLGIALGVSGYDPAEVADLNRQQALAMAQLPGNAFDQRVVGEPECAGELTLRSAFLQGLLLMTPDEAARRVPESAKPMERWQQWCAAHEVTPVEGSLAIAKGLPADYVVVGVDRPSQWEEIAAAWSRVSPSPATELAVDDARVIDPRCWRR